VDNQSGAGWHQIKVVDAARREGLAVGQWLERRVNEWLDGAEIAARRTTDHWAIVEPGPLRETLQVPSSRRPVSPTIREKSDRERLDELRGEVATLRNVVNVLRAEVRKLGRERVDKLYNLPGAAGPGED
jgi:hypothetical protein